MEDASSLTGSLPAARSPMSLRSWGVSRPTSYRWIRRFGAEGLRSADGASIRAARTTANRLRARLQELVHLDGKKLGRIPDGGGWRADGRSEQVKGRGIGYDYVHVAIDEHTRIGYAEVPPTKRAPPRHGSAPAPRATSPRTASTRSNAPSPTTPSPTATPEHSAMPSLISEPCNALSSPSAPGPTAKPNGPSVRPSPAAINARPHLRHGPSPTTTSPHRHRNHTHHPSVPSLMRVCQVFGVTVFDAISCRRTIVRRR